MSAAGTGQSENALRILVIEDERKLAGRIAEGLEGNGYEGALAEPGETGIKKRRNAAFDLVPLGVMLPRQGGLETLREMRRSGLRTPVLMLTSRGSVDDRVRGLDAGADDYLVKPFAFPELLARVRALHRRPHPESSSVLQLADLKMDISGRAATRGNMTLDLTGREFDLLEYLLLNSGSVVSRVMGARDVGKTT